MKQYLLIITILLLVTSCRKQTTLYDELRAEGKFEAAYHFYPSTLRMLNFQKDTSINKMVKDIRKLSLLTMKPNALDTIDLISYVEELKTEKQYELYLEVDSPEGQCYILGNAEKEQTVALYGQSGKHYLMDVYGKVDFMQLPRVYKVLSEQDSTTTTGFSILFDRMKEDSDNEARWRENRRKRDERHKREKAEREARKDEDEIQDVIDATLQE